jgi:hypothetical protein
LYIGASYNLKDSAPRWEFKHTKIVLKSSESEESEEEEEEDPLDVEDVPTPKYKKDDEEGPTGGTSVPVY